MTDTEQEATREGLVTAELVAIRQGVGLTYARVKAMAPELARLEVTTSEATRTGVLPSVAAYHVIKCAVVNEIAHPEFRRILVRTLNLDGAGPGKLTDRREALIGEQEVSDNTYLRRETDAYAELTSFLVAARRTPCRGHIVELGDVLELARRRIQDEEGAEPTLSLEIPIAPLLAQLVQWITDDPTGRPTLAGPVEEPSRAHVEALSTLLPRLAAYSKVHKSAVEFLVLLNEGVVRLMPGSFPGPPVSLPADVAARLLRAANDYWLASLCEPALTQLFTDEESGQRFAFASPEFFTLKGQTERLLASAMERIDAEDQWNRVFFDPGGPRARRSSGPRLPFDRPGVVRQQKKA